MDELIIWDQVERFCGLLGRSMVSVDAILYPPKDGPGSGKGAHLRRLDQAGCEGIEQLLSMPAYQHHSLGIRPNPGGIKAADITEGRAIWFEVDGELSIDAQEALPSLLGLPEPTVTVWSGGKSLHQYWTAEKGHGLSPSDWRKAQERLIAAVKKVAPDAGVDEAIKDLGRAMRAPGGIHPVTGSRCCLHSESGSRYDLASLVAVLPPLTEESLQAKMPLSAESGDSRFPSPSIQEIHAALGCVPRRVAGSGTYPIYRNLLWGLIAVLRETGATDPVEEGIVLMESHSPSEQSGWDVEQVGRYEYNEVGVGTFWYIAKGFGYKVKCSKSTTKESVMSYQIKKASEVCADVGKIKWNIEGFAATGLVLVAAETGTGKTTLLYRAADAVQEGALFLDQVPVRKGRVLVVQGDEPESIAVRKIRRMGLKANFDFLYAESSIDLDFLLETIRKADYQVLIIDSLTTVLASSDCTTLDQSMVDKLFAINRVAADQGVLILMTAHLNKPAKDGNGNRKQRRQITWADISGLSTIGAAVNDCWGLTKAGNFFSLHCLGKRNVDAGVEWLLERDAEDYWWGLKEITDGLMPLVVVDAKQRILQVLAQDQLFVTAKEAAKILDINEEHSRRCLCDLYDEGVLDRRVSHLPGRGRPGHCYGLK